MDNRLYTSLDDIIFLDENAENKVGNPYHDKLGRFTTGSGGGADFSSNPTIDNYEYLTKTYKVSKATKDKYTDAISEYTGASYRSVNEGLRRDKGDLSKMWKEDSDIVKGMDAAIDSGAQKLKRNTVVYRGARISSTLREGQVLINHGFVSTSLNQGIPRTFAKKDSFLEAQYLFKMTAPKGIDVIVPDAYNAGGGIQENEIIFPRGTKMLIKKISHDGELNIVEAEYRE